MGANASGKAENKQLACCASCDLCDHETDREECIAIAPTRSTAARLPVQAVDVPVHEETLLSVFGGELFVY